MQNGIEIREQVLLENCAVETLGLQPTRFGSEFGSVLLKFAHCVYHAFHGLLHEPDPCWGSAPGQRQNSFGRSATAKGDDWRATGHGLDRHDAEVFLAREQ